MLVLTRKLGEKVLIGPNIWVTVVDIEANKVRLGITAPPEVEIWREELLQEVPVTDAPREPARAQKG